MGWAPAVNYKDDLGTWEIGILTAEKSGDLSLEVVLDISWGYLKELIEGRNGAWHGPRLVWQVLTVE